MCRSASSAGDDIRKLFSGRLLYSSFCHHLGAGENTLQRSELTGSGAFGKGLKCSPCTLRPVCCMLKA